MEATDMQETRSLKAIERDAREIDDNHLETVLHDLTTTRRKIATALDNFEPGTDAWKAAVDQEMPTLDQAERETLRRLEGIRDSLNRDRAQLTELPYRPGLSGDQLLPVEQRAAAMAARLPDMTVDEINAQLKAAVMHGDTDDMAVWALNAAALLNRPTEQSSDGLPKGIQKSLLRECQNRTCDKTQAKAVGEAETALQRVHSAIHDTSVARAAHDPTGGVGSPLLTHQYGDKQGSRGKWHDPEAVRTRLGRKA